MDVDVLLVALLAGGARPAAHLLSFASPKESRQRKGDPTGCDPALRSGQPVSGRWRGGPQNSLRACSASFRQPRPVRSRSGCILRCSRHPANTPPQAHPEGREDQTGHRCARPPRRGRVAPRSQGRVQRWPVWRAPPRPRASQVAPKRSAGDTSSGGAFLLGTFLWRSKEKYLGRRAESRPLPSTKPNHLKIIAASAHQASAGGR
jgi:hypothetical protein